MNRFLVIFALLCIYTVTSQDSICVKYSKALKVNNKILVESVVNGTINEIFTNPMAGIKRFFDGTHPNQTINYGTNIAAQNNLRRNLVSFFGMALGCNDNTIPPYKGKTMQQAHARLSINYFSSAQFARILTGVLRKAGVTYDDMIKVATVLDSLRGVICIEPDCKSFCNKYSVPVKFDNLELVGAVVDGTFMKALASASLKKYFDGTIPAGSTDYTKDPFKFSMLRNHLIEFFGMALDCTDRTIGIYNGGPLSEAHRSLTIGLNIFNEFINAVTSVMTAAGVSGLDVEKADLLLKFFKFYVCFLENCGCSRRH